MSPFDHIFLYCLMFILAIAYDKAYRLSLRPTNLVYRKDNTSIIAVLLGCVFVLTEGLRYGRGVDQLGNYGPFYLHCMNAKAWFQEFEPLFVWINQCVYKIDPFRGTLPFGIIFIVYALIFFICLFIYYKDKRNETKLFLLFAILSTNYITEWTIRQGVSFSFILLGLHFLEKRKWAWMVCFMFVAFSIHHGNILAITLPIVFYFFLNKKPVPWKVTVPLFIIFEYTMQVSVFQNAIQTISSLVNVNSLAGNMGDYMQEDALAHEAEVSEEWERGAFTQFITVLFYSSLLIIGAITCNVKNKITYIYNSFVIGIMIYEPFRLAGSISRMFNVLSCLWFIPLAYAIYNYKQVISVSKLAKWLFIVVILYITFYYGRYVFLSPNANYTWNM